MRALLSLLLLSAVARAEPVVLRLATAVPEGTEWARVGKAFARDVEELTRGQVKVKWYLGGIAGNELQMLDRVKRDQLDGVGSGGVVCQRMAPTIRVTRMVGLIHTRAEAELVVTRLKPILDEEFKRNGFVNLWEAGLGTSLIFSRSPVQTMEDLKKARLWTWDIDNAFSGGLRALGIPVVTSSLDDAAHAYDSGTSDGFITMPVAALAFQWSAQTRYLTNLPMGFLSACFLMSNRTFDALPVEHQQAIRQASAKFQARMEEVGRSQDRALVEGGLFKRQGLQIVQASQTFRDAFYSAAKAVRDADTSVTTQLKADVESWLNEYRRK
jgi:TRAP-type C4-dicarboxylate transport system substrate-binding protein